MAPVMQSASMAVLGCSGRQGRERGSGARRGAAVWNTALLATPTIRGCSLSLGGKGDSRHLGGGIEVRRWRWEVDKYRVGGVRCLRRRRRR